MTDHTIVALASGNIPAGVAILRVSGSQALDSIMALTGLDAITPRQTYFSNFTHPHTKKILDKGLVVYFQNPQSFTGEDVAEFHIHGGRAVIDRMLNTILSLDHIRMADPGEFTKRAYINGKIDLTEAEAINDLVHAETDAQADLALEQMGGSLRDLYEGWADTLKKKLAYIEADIDFSDEELPESLADKMRPDIQCLYDGLQEHLNDAHKGERLREGIYVAILGVPNAGKSSLINVLAKRDVAIVSSQAGTTRDAIEVHLNLDGYPITLIDTAGIRESIDDIENEGIKRAIERAESSDLNIVLFPANETPDRKMLELVNQKTIAVISKADLPQIETTKSDLNNISTLSLSTENGDGIKALLDAISAKIKTIYDKPRSSPLLTRKRHRLAVENTAHHLERALNAPDVELMAEDVRLAVRELGRITGRVDVEDLLDVIFRDFCIGK